MRRQIIHMSSTLWVVCMVTVALIALGVYVRASAKSSADADSNNWDWKGRIVARGGGTTFIQEGTGAAGGFMPVLTTVSFHAERSGGNVTGAFDCLARAPAAASGPGSAQFTVNAMYVAGEITSAVVQGEVAALTGTANVTGLGAGTDVPFNFVVRQGGPGATAVLTVSGLQFNEVLVEGSFEVPGRQDSRRQQTQQFSERSQK
jgi:hypothetical protein